MFAFAAFGFRAQLIALVCMVLGACASDPVSLDPRPNFEFHGAKVPAPIAYLHTKEFREDVRAVEPYGNRYYLPMKVGEASDRALRAAYDSVLADARELGTFAEVAKFSADRPEMTVLEPSILRFNYINASGRQWEPYYAEVVYGFVLHDAKGAPVGQWQVTGFGEFDMNREVKERRADFPRGETDVISEAARRAVANGVASFVAGFEQVPELMRLARNLPLAESNASPSKQVTRTVASAIEAEYPKVLTLRVEPFVMPTPPKEAKSLESLAASPVFFVRLGLRNSGPHRLAFDPSNAQWLPEGTPADMRGAISHLPASVASVLLTGRPGGVAIGTMSPGIGMLPALLGALFSAAENERHKEELAAWRAAIEGDYLSAITISGGRDRSGILCFPRGANATGGTLVLPVIDLDDAVRYTVRVPLPAK